MRLVLHMYTMVPAKQLNCTLLEKAQSIWLETCLHIYNHISIRYLKWRIPQEIFLENKPKTSYFHVFGCKAYMFFPIKVYTNKLVPYSKLIIFIEYEDNKYHFMHHIQGNIIFCSTHAIFDKRLFPKCTNFHAKEHKLYDELLNKTSLETELLVPDSSGKDRSALVPIPHIPISPIQNNLPTHSPLPSLSYKFTSPLSCHKLHSACISTTSGLIFTN